MKIQKIRTIAQGLGVETAGREKTELIRAIQKKEGNFDCFATARDGICDRYDCRWRTDCFAAAKVTRLAH
jgi:hypothetical protein